MISQGIDLHPQKALSIKQYLLLNMPLCFIQNKCCYFFNCIILLSFCYFTWQNYVQNIPQLQVLDRPSIGKQSLQAFCKLQDIDNARCKRLLLFTRGSIKQTSLWISCVLSVSLLENNGRVTVRRDRGKGCEVTLGSHC